MDGTEPMRRSGAAVALAIVAVSCARASASNEPAHWNAELPVYLTATTAYRSGTGSWRGIASILVELRLARVDRPWSIGPVVEVHRTVNGRDDTTVGAGIIVRHHHRHWDTTAIVYRHMPQHAPDYSWNYGARLRYQVSPAGRIGAEAYGAIRRIESSDLWIGYYGDVTRTFSFRLLAGTNLDDPGARLLRLDLVLEVH